MTNTCLECKKQYSCEIITNEDIDISPVCPFFIESVLFCKNCQKSKKVKYRGNPCLYCEINGIIPEDTRACNNYFGG